MLKNNYKKEQDELRKITKEEITKAIMDNMDSTLIFIYIKNLEDRIKDLEDR